MPSAQPCSCSSRSSRSSGITDPQLEPEAFTITGSITTVLCSSNSCSCSHLHSSSPRSRKHLLHCMSLAGLLCFLHLALLVQPSAASYGGNHTSNWAVIVCTSRYWYNYRHMSNALSFYRTVKRLGIPDSNILLMLADDVPCNPRNPYPGHVYNSETHKLNVYGTDVEVDYRGYEVTVENFIRVLTGRHDPAVPRSKRMLSDEGSNVLVYLTGHGGNDFLKFQDVEELMAQDVADAVAQMAEKGRYNELLLVFETCQAATMYSKVKSPRVLSMSSSIKGESSYSYGTDMDVGLSLIDRFTYASLEFFEQVDIHSNLTMADLVKIYRYDLLESHFHYETANYHRPLSQVQVTEFFGSVSDVQTLHGCPSYRGAATTCDRGDVTACQTTPTPPAVLEVRPQRSHNSAVEELAGQQQQQHGMRTWQLTGGSGEDPDWLVIGGCIGLFAVAALWSSMSSAHCRA